MPMLVGVKIDSELLMLGIFQQFVLTNHNFVTFSEPLSTEIKLLKRLLTTKQLFWALLGLTDKHWAERGLCIPAHHRLVCYIH